MSFRILLANHQPLVRSALRLLLEQERDFQVVGEAATGPEAIALADFRRPNVVLLEVELPKTSGVAVARQLLATQPSLKIIFVSSLSDIAYVTEAFKAGAHGYVAADEAPASLISAIRTVTSGESFISPAIRERAGLLSADAAL